VCGGSSSVLGSVDPLMVLGLAMVQVCFMKSWIRYSSLQSAWGSINIQSEFLASWYEYADTLIKYVLRLINSLFAYFPLLDKCDKDRISLILVWFVNSLGS
jgi:hypothetical protein